MQIFDGQEYLDTAPLPDLGGITCIAVTGGGIREYKGKSADFGKLKAYSRTVPLLTGSFVHLEDTDETYEFFAIDKSWNLVSRGGSGGSGAGGSSSGTSGPSYDFNVIGENLQITNI